MATDEFQIHGVRPKCVVEPSPQRKPYHDNAGMMMGFLQKKGVPAEAIKPEWGTSLRIFDIRGPRPKEVANFDVRKGWSVFQGNLEALVPRLKAEDVVAAMRR